MVVERPQVRRDCLEGVRPCPFIGCEHHLIWGANRNVWKKRNEAIVNWIFRRPETCVLDVADKGPATLDDIGAMFGITKERVRQAEICKKGGAIKKMRKYPRKQFLEEFVRG